MSRLKIIIAIIALLYAGRAMAAPLAVSPGGSTEAPVIGQVCPTFSWSAVRGAVAYRVEVYELVLDGMSRDQMRKMTLPVISEEISAPAYSWTPAAGECLPTGSSYIWYVEDLNEMGEGSWSTGKSFNIEPPSLTEEQKEALQEVVREYLQTDQSVAPIGAETALGGSTAIRQESTVVPMTVTEGSVNTRLGTGSGAAMDPNFGTGTQYVTFIGAYAGYNNTTGTNDTFVGMNAGNSNTTGSSNTFVGKSAGAANSDGYYNSFFGTAAGFMNDTGFRNSFFGPDTGHSNTTGAFNTFIGMEAGYMNQTGGGNVFLGYNAGYNETGSNKLYIANSDTPFPLIHGDFAENIVTINGSLTMVTVAALSDERYKKDVQPLESSLEKVLRLQGVSYEWKTEELKGRGFKDGRQIGLIAQEVEKVFPELVQTDSKGYKSLSYDKLTAVLIEAIKEQQHEMKHKEALLEASLKEKDARIEKLEKERESTTAMLKELSMRIAAVEKPSQSIAVK